MRTPPNPQHIETRKPAWLLATCHVVPEFGAIWRSFVQASNQRDRGSSSRSTRASGHGPKGLFVSRGFGIAGEHPQYVFEERLKVNVFAQMPCLWSHQIIFLACVCDGEEADRADRIVGAVSILPVGELDLASGERAGVIHLNSPVGLASRFSMPRFWTKTIFFFLEASPFRNKMMSCGLLSNTVPNEAHFRVARTKMEPSTPSAPLAF